MTELCNRGHELTVENIETHTTTVVTAGEVTKSYTRTYCLLCREIMRVRREGTGKGRTGRPRMSAAERNARFEDLEELLDFGERWEQVIERSAWDNWKNMRYALKKHGRDDLIERMDQRKLED